jgi:hypothetical protein
MTGKKHLRMILAAIVILACAAPASAIKEIGIGLGGGMTYDPNNLEQEIASYNHAMENYRRADPGTDTEQINVPYAGILGMNVRFRIEFFLIRLGFNYIQAFANPATGSVKPAGGPRNTISFNTWQISLPLSIGFMLEATRRCIFSFGGGFSVFFVNLEISQSDPDPALGLPGSASREVFDTHLFGYHLFIGVEFPLVIKRLSISAEWVFQQGISEPVRSSTSSRERTINVTGNHLVFGINYYFTIGQ